MLKLFRPGLLVGIGGLLAVSPVLAQDAPMPASGTDGHGAYSGPPGLTVEVAVSRSGSQAAYSIILRNYGSAEVKDVFLAGTVAEGTSFLEPGPNPAGAGFRGVENGAAVWLAERVPARGTAGPFIYKVKLSGETAPAIRAWTHWRQPADGSAVSGPIRTLPPLTSATLASFRMDSAPTDVRKFSIQQFLDEPNSTGRHVTHPSSLAYILEGTETLDQDGRRVTYGPGGAFLHTGPHIHFNLANGPRRFLTFSIPPVDAPNAENTLFASDPFVLRGGPYVASLSMIEG